MIILTLRTDRPEAELALYENEVELAKLTWQAHRQLADTIHLKLQELLISVKASRLDLSSERVKYSTCERYKSSNSINEIQGIVCFKGPGSFTGLRIGLSVANALAHGNDLPIVARSGKDWLVGGISDLLSGQNDHLALPEYDRPAATSNPKK